MRKNMSASNTPTTRAQIKAPVVPMEEERKQEIIIQYMDDVVAKLTSSFFEVVSKEKWGKRDLSIISGLNETAIGHILSGRRKNLTVETVALLARAMKKRPELLLHDTRPVGNHFDTLRSAAEAPEFSPQVSSASAASAVQSRQWQRQAPSAEKVIEQILQGIDHPSLSETV